MSPKAENTDQTFHHGWTRMNTDGRWACQSPPQAAGDGAASAFTILVNSPSRPAARRPPKSGLGGGARNDLNPTGGGNKKSDMPKNACGSQALAESDPNPVVLYIEYQLRYVKTNQQAFGW